MNIPEHIRQARARKRKELLRLGLQPTLVPRPQVVRFPDLSLEQMRQRLMRQGEDPDFEEIWLNA